MEKGVALMVGATLIDCEEQKQSMHRLFFEVFS
jgi:hypothetical protein